LLLPAVQKSRDVPPPPPPPQSEQTGQDLQAPADPSAALILPAVQNAQPEQAAAATGRRQHRPVSLGTAQAESGAQGAQTTPEEPAPARRRGGFSLSIGGVSIGNGGVRVAVGDVTGDGRDSTSAPSRQAPSPPRTPARASAPGRGN
jgi:hypothetical protein